MKIYMTFHTDPYEVMKCRKYPDWKIKAILAWRLLLRKHGTKSYTTYMTLKTQYFPTVSTGVRNNRTIFLSARCLQISMSFLPQQYPL